MRGERTTFASLNLKFFGSMLNRRHIRIKVMQTIYAYKGGEGGDFKADQTFLLRSIENMYNLYLLQVSLLIKLQERSEDFVMKTQQKQLATSDDKNPNKKFISQMPWVRVGYYRPVSCSWSKSKWRAWQDLKGWLHKPSFFV